MLNKTNNSPSIQKLIIYIVLAATTLAVYWQVNQFDFVNFDDNIYVSDNIGIKSGITLDGIRWAFTTKYFDFWTPLVWLSFMFDYQFNGLNAGGYHITNLFFHIMGTLLLFWLFNRMTKEIWKSAFVAAMFALHPLHVESVVWISERKDVLSAFFWILTLCMYVYYTEKPVIRRYLLVLLSFILAIMSKPMVVTLPVILILLDYWPLKRFELQKGNFFLWQLKEKSPFFVLSAVLVIVTFYNPNENEISRIPFPFSYRLANDPVAFVTYLAQTFWPHDMAIFYPFPAHILLWQGIGASLLIILITTIVILMAQRLPYLFTGWFWFSVSLLPVLGAIHGSLYAMADRYHYLPSIGISIILAWGVPSLFKNESMRKNILLPAVSVFLAVMSVLTWKQCHNWESSSTVFGHALQVTKNNAVAHIQLGLALYEEGKTQQAIEHYNLAIGIPSAYADDCAYNSRGAAYAKLGQYKLAIEDFNKQIHINPSHFKSYNNRGVVYYKLGLYQQAIEDFNKSIIIDSAYANAYDNKAFLYLNMGNIVSGCSNAQKACKLGNCRTLTLAKSKGLCK